MTEQQWQTYIFPLTAGNMASQHIQQVFFATAEHSTPTACDASTRALISFTCFPELPQELRDLIWEKALPEPRIIKYTVAHDVVPVILHVIRESRAVGLSNYQLAFRHFEDKEVYRYIDFSKDTYVLNTMDHIWLGANTALPRGTVNLQDNVKFLDVPGSPYSRVRHLVKVFTKLEEVVLSNRESRYPVPPISIRIGTNVSNLPTLPLPVAPMLDECYESNLIRELRETAAAHGIPASIPKFEHIRRKVIEGRFGY